MVAEATDAVVVDVALVDGVKGDTPSFIPIFGPMVWEAIGLGNAKHPKMDISVLPLLKIY